MLSNFRLMASRSVSKCAGSFKRLFQFSLIAAGLAVTPQFVEAQGFVPGSGQRLTQVGDDFEEPNWNYILNEPKSSSEQDKQERLPAGRATNGRWGEGLMRGQPDVVKRVLTPPDGIPGSEGALLMVSKFTTIPNSPSNSIGQDDFICLVDSRIGGPISVARSPSVVTHVFLPPWEKWERRAGNSFCFRAACQAWKTEQKKSSGFKLFGGVSTSRKLDTYWPGILVNFNPGDGKNTPDSANLVVRAAHNGGDYRRVDIKEPGWWTLGMSFTPDGQIHYYAHAGVEPLTQKDHIASENPYGMHCEQVSTFFFDVLNQDNGTWSTPWIVDDSFVYVGR